MSRGFVPTPTSVVDLMVDRLFSLREPKASDWLLDPGCGTGLLIDGVLRWCAKKHTSESAGNWLAEPPADEPPVGTEVRNLQSGCRTVPLKSPRSGTSGAK